MPQDEGYYHRKAMKEQHGSWSNIERWLPQQMPIPVYVLPLNWESDLITMAAPILNGFIQSALAQWQRALPEVVRFIQVDAPPPEGITIRWVRQKQDHWGYCTYETVHHHVYKQVYITVGLPERSLNDMTLQQEIFSTLLHEVGHALGLPHTDKPQDVMFTKNFGPRIRLSENDKATLRRIYQLPHGYSIIKKGKAMGLAEPIRMDVVLEQMERSQDPAMGPIAALSQESPEMQRERLEQEAQKAHQLMNHHSILVQRNQVVLATQNLPKFLGYKTTYRLPSVKHLDSD